MTERRGPWTRHGRVPLCATSRLTAYRDEVTLPHGGRGTYDWVQVPDQVRVAALVEGELLVVEQYHYLAGPMWQLPGGAVEPVDRSSCTAAQRELAEETGYRGGRWGDKGSLYVLPGLTPARVHLWSTIDPTPSRAAPERAEADLLVRHVSVEEAMVAVRDGRLQCAASAALVMMLALERSQ
ncbi:NUDIX domain-containing protein [Streptomyces paradoxus]|uniref:NUDIX domain-containing protein n=1 Tax=Streptomyces paradoxus TaxID=66375 RepID=UPI00363DA5E4